jgi:ComF family protein
MFLIEKTRRFALTVRGILFPSACVLCREPLPLEEKGFCLPCSEKIARLERPQCRLCGAEIPALKPGHLCRDCRSTKRSFSKGRAFFRYNLSLKRIIRKAKYAKRFDLWTPLFEKAMQQPGTSYDSIDCVASVPMTRLEKFSRETNSSQTLAEAFAERLNIPHLPLLRKKRNTPPQAQLSKKERQRNLKGAFEIRNKINVRGKKILLVDDILTTGSTLQEAAQTLKTEGAAQVEIAVLARSGRYADS